MLLYLALKLIRLLFPKVALSAHLAMIFSFMLRIECVLPSARISETWNGDRIFPFAVLKRK